MTPVVEDLRDASDLPAVRVVAWGAAAWVLILATAGVLEAWGVRHPGREATLSEAVRRGFRVRTSRSGRIVFAAAWGAFSAWFLRHITDG